MKIVEDTMVYPNVSTCGEVRGRSTTMNLLLRKAFCG